MAKRKAKPAQDDALKSYFDQIRKTELLTFEQELELSRRIEAGDEQARTQLIEANLRLVVKIAKAYVSPDVSLLDLVQEGNLGLLKAAGKYDHRKQVRFSTYASWWIKQSITRALSNKRRSIRLPHRKEDALRKIQRAHNALSQRLMRRPSVDEVAKEVGMESSEVVQIMNIATGPVSLDSDLNSDSGTLHDVFEDYSYSPDTEVMKKEMRQETLRFLERLREKEKMILLYRFAFYGGKKYTLKRISDEMGISPETVRQIELRALRKLREHSSEIEEFVYG
ncbi:MAG: sigma-70 family RNA polymerase sigma factor [Spirochaetaceae bacterium]|nr:MAG: sigma-70 family RNA polymerase sigma factor [Spirochaetaceae bacterium]